MDQKESPAIEAPQSPILFGPLRGPKRIAKNITGERGASTAEIVRAYFIVRHIFAVPKVWRAIEALDGKIHSQIQFSMMLGVTQVARRATRWILNHYRHQLNVTKRVNKFAVDVQNLLLALPTLLNGTSKLCLEQAIEEYCQEQVPLLLATTIVCINKAFAALNIVASAQQHRLPVHQVVKVCFVLDNELYLTSLREQIHLQPIKNRWDISALAGLRYQLDELQSILAINAFHYTAKKNINAPDFSAWQQHYQHMVHRWQLIITSINQSSDVDIVMLFVAIKGLTDLANIPK